MCVVLCGVVPQGQTPLHVAASIGHTGLFDLLLTHGADIFRVDDLHQVGTHALPPHSITKRHPPGTHLTCLVNDHTTHPSSTTCTR
jgi:ankyrin repeat protein